VDLYRALTTIADDPAANAKIKIGVAALSAPWAGIAAVGYQVALARRVAAGREAYLPAWDDPASLVRSGFWLALARLLYELPARLLVLATLLLALRPLWAAARAARPLWPWPAREGLSALLSGALIVLASCRRPSPRSLCGAAPCALPSTCRACCD
jgi:hypothetical protein